MGDAFDEPLTPADLPLAYQRGTSTEGILPIAGYVIGDQIGSRLVSDDAGVRLAIVLMTAAAICLRWSFIRAASSPGSAGSAWRKSFLISIADACRS